MNHIDHVVVLMLENRSFDSILGNLYKVKDNGTVLDGFTDEEVTLNHIYTDPPGISSASVDQQQYPFFGWDHMLKENIDLKSKFNLNNTDPRFPPIDPGESYDHVFKQFYNKESGNPEQWKEEVKLEQRIQGTVNDYDTLCKAKGGNPPIAKGEDILTGFSSATLPVINTLASEFGVCDYWFASVPSQTWPNRCFLHSGTCCGVLRNESWGYFDAIWRLLRTSHPSVFSQLKSTVQVVTGNSKWDQASMITILHHGEAINWRTMDQFSENCLKDKLPSYTFIEPRYWTSSQGVQNDQHCDESFLGSKSNCFTVHRAEELILEIYEKMFLSPNVNVSNRLLVILYDEHGGNFDHISPPTCVPSTESKEFYFDRLGSRIPAVFISPLIPPHSVLRPYDLNVGLEHCSLIHSLSDRFGMKQNANPMTKRAQNAPTFWKLISDANPADPSGRLKEVARLAKERLNEVRDDCTDPMLGDAPMSSRASKILFANLLINGIKLHTNSGDEFNEIELEEIQHKVVEEIHRKVLAETQSHPHLLSMPKEQKAEHILEHIGNLSADEAEQFAGNCLVILKNKRDLTL